MDLDPRAAIADLSSRLDDAESFLDIAGKEAALVGLRKQASEPSLWDDQERARDVTRTLARFEQLVEQVRGLRSSIEDS
jgi:peptide chain release factor 2